jgi:hypothetical protein
LRCTATQNFEKTHPKSIFGEMSRRKGAKDVK